MTMDKANFVQKATMSELWPKIADYLIEYCDWQRFCYRSKMSKGVRMQGLQPGRRRNARFNTSKAP